MGKKRIVKKGVRQDVSREGQRSSKAISKIKVESAVVYILSTYNNTLMSLADLNGNVLFSSSSGALGFSGAKKGTPYAASKVSGVIAEVIAMTPIKNVNIIVKGIGSGRESAIRSLVAKAPNIAVISIKDATPIPHNGPRPPKPRRV